MRMAGKVLGVCVVAIFAVGCYGKFTATQNIYAFNRYVAPEGKWARTGIFVGLNVAPVYPVALLIDVVLANPVEFWTGVNPIKGSKRWFRKQRSDSANATIEPVEPGTRRIDLVLQDGKRSAFLVVHDRGELRLLAEETGDLVASLKLPPTAGSD